MFARKCGGGQHFVGRVHMHVILLGVVIKITNALHDRIIVPRDVHSVIGDVAGVGHPLAAGHELVFGFIAEGVAHGAVKAAEPHAALDRRAEIFHFVPFDCRHGDHRHDEVKPGDGGIGIGRGGVFHAHLKTVALQKAAHDGA